jgi:hypothetical protein
MAAAPTRGPGGIRATTGAGHTEGKAPVHHDQTNHAEDIAELLAEGQHRFACVLHEAFVEAEYERQEEGGRPADLTMILAACELLTVYRQGASHGLAEGWPDRAAPSSPE